MNPTSLIKVIGPGNLDQVPTLSYTLQNSNLHNYYPKPKCLIIGSFGLLGSYVGGRGDSGVQLQPLASPSAGSAGFFVLGLGFRV